MAKKEPLYPHKRKEVQFPHTAKAEEKQRGGNPEIIGTTKHYIPSGYGYREVERKVLRCVCGREVKLLEPTNTCVCGRDYNLYGQLLAPRSQWGEETGESVGDILRAGHHIEEE